MASAAETTPDIAALPPRIVFFDGVCAFCDGSVRWLIERDPEAKLHFAPLQGETAAAVREAFPERFPSDIDTVVYFRPEADGRPGLALRSEAIFEILREIGGAWAWLSVMRFLPTVFLEWAYRFFARNRYRWFGQLDACPVPSPEERTRSLP